MNGQLNSLESFDSGSNYRFGDKMIHSQRARSLFDLSHLKTTTIPKAGMIVPITWFETLPGDDHDINVDCLLRVLPQVVPLYSRQRLYIYAFYSRYSDLWCNWQVFMDKGYTGNDNRHIPTIYLDQTQSPQVANFTSSTTDDLIEPDSMFDYLGLPIGIDTKNLFYITSSQSVNAGISALPFMMFLRVYRDYFMNKNHWISDRVMLPDDDSRFRLDDDGLLLSAKDQNKKFKFYNAPTGTYDLSINASGTYLFSGCMHDYPDDYFTSALPFAQRGTAATITTTGTISGNLNFANAVQTFTPPNPGTFTEPQITQNGKIQGHIDGSSSDASSWILTALNNGTFSGTAIALNITLERLRQLAIDQQEMEQLARTDGSYFQFGLSFFGEPSKAAYDYRPTYIGGTYKNIAFTEVLQTATTQTTDSQSQTVDNPAGAYVGHGITGISNGRIGHIHCDDFGMIMLFACIMPDVYYSQGLDKTWTESVQEEKFLPDRALLGMQPILNKEIYYAGNNGSSLGEDNYLWAYQNPFDHLRYIPNKISGKIADPNNNTFYPYTQARHFTQLPNWGRDFSSTNDVRQDYLTAPSEDAYTAQFSMNIRSVRPLPYKAVPAKLVHA